MKVGLGRSCGRLDIPPYKLEFASFAIPTVDLHSCSRIDSLLQLGRRPIPKAIGGRRIPGGVGKEKTVRHTRLKKRGCQQPLQISVKRQAGFNGPFSKFQQCNRSCGCRLSHNLLKLRVKAGRGVRSQLDS